jgi:hypothetical protein
LEKKHLEALALRAEAQKAVDIQRAQLVAADQQVKVMEKLRDKKREDHERDEDHRERLEQEEIQAAYQYRKLLS